MPRKKTRNLRIQTHQDLYSCLDCDYKSNCLKAIDLHQKLTHKQERRLAGTWWKCVNCEKSFEGEKNLLNHMKKNHRL